MSLETLSARHARYRRNDTALVFGAQRLTHADFDARANRAANALAGLGLVRGDRVGLLLDNSIELVELYVAAMKTGVVVVPLSPLLRAEGLLNLLLDAGVSALVTMERLAGEVDAIRPRLGLDDERILVARELVSRGDRRRVAGAASAARARRATIRSTSSTAPARPASRRGSCTRTRSARRTAPVSRARSACIPESVALHAGSLVFNGSFLTLMPALYLGCTYVLMPAFDPAAMLAALAAERVTHVMMVPSQIVALLQHDDFDEAHLPALEMVGSVGAPLLLEHKQELMRRLPGRFYELYGVTEGFVTVLDRDDAGRKTASVGVPPPLYELRIVDADGVDLPPGQVGEIVGRGPTTMPGYHARPDLTAQTLVDGWVHSGDLGYVDEDGFLYLVDRKKDLVISGGVNVFPRDIEEVAIQHPDVLDVAVFGVPDDRWGESPVAAVRLRPGAATGAVELRDWINDRVQARYQRVREVVVRDEFPLSVAGKTLRRVIRDDYLEET